jgi:hypothetical protein
MKKLVKVLGLFWGIGLFTGCGGGGHNSESSPIDALVQVTLAKETMESLDSLSLTVSATGMVSIHKKWSGFPGVADLGGIPPGSARRFLAKGYAGGKIVQQGEAVADLVAGETKLLNISLEALFGFVQMEVPLGMSNPLGVQTGLLLLTGNGQNDSLALSGTLPNKYFRSGPLPLNQKYRIEVQLFDSAGKLIYSGEDSAQVSASTPEIALVLRSLVAGVSLGLILKSNPDIYGKVILPGSLRRVPRASQDLLILEMLPNPKSNGNDYEYTEIFNATLDTLNLDSCRLAKDRVTTGTTTAVKLLGCSIAPGAFAIVGRDSVPFADCSAGEFSLSNTGQSVIVHCGNLLVDSIAYSSPTDSLNPFPLVVGKSLEIPIARHLERALGTKWCAGVDTVSMAHGLFTLGSPGLDATCE